MARNLTDYFAMFTREAIHVALNPKYPQAVRRKAEYSAYANARALYRVVHGGTPAPKDYDRNTPELQAIARQIEET